MSIADSDGVADNNNTFSGYAWGGDVVGWIDFASVGTSPAAPVHLVSSGLPLASVVITASSTTQIGNSITVPPGEKVDIGWKVTGATQGCIPSSENPSIPAWNNTTVTPDGSGNTVGTTTDITMTELLATTFTLTCSSPGGANSQGALVTVTDAPEANFDLQNIPATLAI
ncbi:MAG: hypothetical protein AAB538_03790, partial [Patescibacteria group bacterium]